MRNRYYDPVNGTWISRAGIEYQKAGEHAYGYAENDPVRMLDPDGRQPSRNNCKKVVYACFRDISYGLAIVHHTYFWIHNPCNSGKDRTIGYGPVGSFLPEQPSDDNKKRKGKEKPVPTYPQQPEDFACIHNQTCTCYRTTCDPGCIDSMGKQIGPGKVWDPNDFHVFNPDYLTWDFSVPSLIDSFFKPGNHKRCWDFTETSFSKCNRAETGNQFWPGTAPPLIHHNM